MLGRLDTSVPEGCVCLDTVQQHNLHIAAGKEYDFRCCILHICPPVSPVLLIYGLVTI